MLKVLLVDDEPFILQGIKVIIDWEKEGFEIAATAENGLEALEYLKKEIQNGGGSAPGCMGLLRQYQQN